MSTKVRADESSRVKQTFILLDFVQAEEGRGMLAPSQYTVVQDLPLHMIIFDKIAPVWGNFKVRKDLLTNIEWLKEEAKQDSKTARMHEAVWEILSKPEEPQEPREKISQD